MKGGEKVFRAFFLRGERAMPSIGVPRALYYYKYFPFIKEFFTSLGCRVIVSPKTNKAIIDNGLRLAVDESCLSLKVFLGHVNELIDQADFLFVPMLESVVEGESLCTRFMALPDIVRNTFLDARMIEPEIIDNNFLDLVLGETGLITRNVFKKATAFKKAVAAQRRFQRLMAMTSDYREILDIMNDKRSKRKSRPYDVNVALLGHAYNVYDAFIGEIVARKLQALNVGIKTVEMLPLQETHSAASLLSKDMYWTYNKEIIGAARLFIDRGIDGIIFLTTFPCGPDALSLELTIRTLKNQVPILNLVFDELAGDAGLDTRLETFVDMIGFRMQARTA